MFVSSTGQALSKCASNAEIFSDNSGPRHILHRRENQSKIEIF
jgi:hypothetical protein